MESNRPNNTWQGDCERAWPICPLIRVSLCWWGWKWHYVRIMNAGALYWLCFRVIWRLPVKPWVAWRMGWDAANVWDNGEANKHRNYWAEAMKEVGRG